MAALPWSYLITIRVDQSNQFQLNLGQPPTPPKSTSHTRIPVGVGQSQAYLCILDQSMGGALGRRGATLLWACCMCLVGLCDGLRLTEVAMPAKPVAVAVLLHIAHSARLAVVAIRLVEGQGDRKPHLCHRDVAPKVACKRRKMTAARITRARQERWRWQWIY